MEFTGVKYIKRGKTGGKRSAREENICVSKEREKPNFRRGIIWASIFRAQQGGQCCGSRPF
jgi:hypothetical protein